MLLLLIKLLIKALFIYLCDRIRDSARFIKLAQNQLKPKFNQGFMQRTCLCSLCLIFAWYLRKFSRHIAAHFITHFCDFFFHALENFVMYSSAVCPQLCDMQRSNAGFYTSYTMHEWISSGEVLQENGRLIGREVTVCDEWQTLWAHSKTKTVLGAWRSYNEDPLKAH